MEDFSFFKLTNTRETNIIDIELQKLDILKEYDTVEVDIEFAPKSWKITSGDFDIEPFQNDVKNSDPRHTGKYRKIIDPYAVWFGALLWGIITAVVWAKNPGNIWEIESQATIWVVTLGWYAWWGRVEEFLQRITRWLSFEIKECIYNYILTNKWALHAYSTEHEKSRFESPQIIPTKFDIYKQTSSEMLRLAYTKENICETLDNSARICRIRVKQDLIASIQEGLGMTFKLKLWMQDGIVLKKHELIQAFTDQDLRCRDNSRKKYKTKVINQIEAFTTSTVWRIKKFKNHWIIEGILIENQLFSNSNSTPPNLLQWQTATPPASLTNSRVGKIVPLEQLG